MTEDRLLQKLKRHEGKILRERNTPELTTEFSRRLVACLNGRENELEKEKRRDRPQEEGDLIERRIKEKKRLKRDRSDRVTGVTDTTSLKEKGEKRRERTEGIL